jgi:hypothetical protein
MRAKHTSPVRSIFMKDTSIIMEPWPNWELLTKAYPMTLGYSHSRVTLSVTARVASVGDRALACEQLARAIRLPTPAVSYDQLKLLPFWDPLRGDPRFEKIVASLAPN